MESLVDVNGKKYTFQGNWVDGSAWQRFGLYNSYVVIREDGSVMKMPAHAGELVPGSTEDLVAVIRSIDPRRGYPPAPMTLELDPTYACASKDCGGHCFSRSYRSLRPGAYLPVNLVEGIVQEFSTAGGRILRFDGGGDPLLHKDVRSGRLVRFASNLGLKTTILTSGDLLPESNLAAFAEANCYVRVSLNASTNSTRQKFHGNKISLDEIFASIERLAFELKSVKSETPIGATYLLAPMNYREVYDCAIRAREKGISHFSVRRVLGPPSLRPVFSPDEECELAACLEAIRSLHCSDFRVAVPWRSVAESDVNLSAGQFVAEKCWQSTLKVIVEPGEQPEEANAALCGRYRGGGVGQASKLRPLFSTRTASDWIMQWQSSFENYPITRETLPSVCTSCIDRGFILMVDRLMRFIRCPMSDFKILHLNSPTPFEYECKTAALL